MEASPSRRGWLAAHPVSATLPFAISWAIRLQSVSPWVRLEPVTSRLRVHATLQPCIPGLPVIQQLSEPLLEFPPGPMGAVKAGLNQISSARPGVSYTAQTLLRHQSKCLQSCAFCGRAANKGLNVCHLQMEGLCMNHRIPVHDCLSCCICQYDTGAGCFSALANRARQGNTLDSSVLLGWQFLMQCILLGTFILQGKLN